MILGSAGRTVHRLLLCHRAAARTGAAPTCAVGLGLPCAVPAGSGAATARRGHAGPWGPPRLCAGVWPWAE